MSCDGLFHQGNSQVHDIGVSWTSLNQAATGFEKRIGIAGIKMYLCVQAQSDGLCADVTIKEGTSGIGGAIFTVCPAR